MNAKLDIINALQQYRKAGKPEPTTLKLSLSKADDLCKLGREDLGDLSHELLKHGPRHLEKTGLLGLKVSITQEGPDIAFE